MQPLLNLKSFLAALLILAVPGALLVAYFRNYSPDADSMGQGHDMGGKSTGMGKDHHMGADSGGMKGDMPMKSHDDMSSGGKHEMPDSTSGEKMKVMPAMSGQSPEDSGPPALLHIGAKGFFLDRPQTFTPRADQAKMLTAIKERTTMEMMATDKKVQEVEQQLWKLTAKDHPDLVEVENKTREVEKLRADQRVAFIRSVAEAANLLTAEQKEMLLH
jgi:Spy/CpxP family protein refolding chaperone